MITENFIVSWKHEKYTVPLRMGKTVRRDSTVCIIQRRNSDVSIRERVGLHYKDKPNRRTGNRAAFAKVVNTITDKNERKELWQGFLALSPKCINC